MQFVMRLAREFRRADWRRMLSEMSATELGEWGDYFRMQSFSDVWMDAQFASLKALIVRMVSGSSDAAVADFSLLEAWKKYRVLLNRVDTSTAPDIEWPALP
ncbi:phage tail assembly protein T [Escherichia coli]